jgi:DNA-binding beta-propeller fold protein YncE
MFADLHSQQKVTKNHFIKRILEPALVAQVNNKIEEALSKLDAARLTLLQLYADMLPARESIEHSARSVKTLRDLFGSMTQAATRIQKLHDNLVKRQQSLQGCHDADLVFKTMAEPHMFLVDEPLNIFKVDISHLKPPKKKVSIPQPKGCIWGAQGSDVAQFHNPLGLAASLCDDRVYVCDSGNSRIQAFNPDGTFLHTWDLAPGPIGFQPAAIAVAPWNEVFVIKHLPSHVNVFTPDGCFQRVWEFQNREEMEMHGGGGPIGIAVAHTGEVIVLSKHVRVFKSDGKFIRKWEIPGTVIALCVTADRHVVIVSKAVCHVFDLEGTRKCSWGGLKDARGVAASNGHIYVAEATGVSVFDMTGIFLHACGSMQAQAVSANDTHVFILNQNHSVEVIPLA